MFLYEMLERVQKAHDAYPPSQYRTLMEFPPGVRDLRKIKGALQMAEDADNHCLFQVVTPYTSTHFKTLREAMDFCKRRGWL